MVFETKQMFTPQGNIPTTLHLCTRTHWIAARKPHTKPCSKSRGEVVPSPLDVICCKGNLAFQHEGNRRLQGIVNSYVDQYEAAQTKGEKSMVVSRVISAVREESGRFLRKDPASGEWTVATARFAREKIGQLFRNALHSQYKSSTASKRRRRDLIQANYDSCLMDVVHSSGFVKDAMSYLSERMNSTDADDETVATMFRESNSRILANFKKSKAAATLSSMITCLRESPHGLQPVLV